MRNNTAKGKLKSIPPSREKAGSVTQERIHQIAKSVLRKLRNQSLKSNELSVFHPWTNRAIPDRVRLSGVNGIDFAGIGVNEAGQRYLRLVVGRGKACRLIIVSAGELASEPQRVFRALVDAGVPLVAQTAKTALINAVQQKIGERPSFLVASQPGWHCADKFFVLPHGVIGEDARGVEFAPSAKSVGYYDKFRECGSSIVWRLRVGKLLHGNSLAMTACAASLLSPLLALLGEENFMLVLVGPPGSGRSTVIVVSSSQWGAHTNRERAMKLGCAETAKRTLNDFDYPAIAHNDLGLAYDDLRSFRTSGNRALALEDLIKGIVEGEERGRATSVERPAAFRCAMVVSTNASLQQEAVGNSYVADRAILDRAPEVPVPAENSAFEDLKGYPSLGAFCRALKEAALKSAGSVSVKYLRALHAWVQADREGCVEWLRERVEEFRGRHRALGAPERVLRRFALVYAAGCLAIRTGLYPWKTNELSAAIAKSLAGHIQLTVLEAPEGATDKASMTARLIAALRAWYQLNQVSLRRAGLASGLVADDPTVRSIPGFLYCHPKRSNEVLLWEDNFAKIVRPVCTPDTAKQLLLEADIIAVDQANARRAFSVKRPLGRTVAGQNWRPNIIALRQSALLLK